MIKTNKQQTIFTDTIHDALSTAIVALDNDLNIIHINAAAENLFSQSRTRVLGNSYTSLFKDKIIQQHLEFVIQNNEPQTLKECRLQGKYYQGITVDCIASPLSKQGKLQGVVLELERIDHQIRISREEQLLAQQEASQILVRGLAHEIKNPLGGLRGAAQLLEAELDNIELKEYTDIIISEADRLQSLVDRMLDTRKQTENEEVNIHEVLERVRKLVRSDLPDNVDLLFDYDPSIPNIYANQDSLIQIVFNIVGNAIKAIGDSGKIIFKTRIIRNYTINQKQHRLTLCLEIIDNGKEVPKDIRDKLFYPMISGSAQGTGLGLSIAQTLANQHGGVIEFESDPAETRFILFLPIPLSPIKKSRSANV